MGAGATGSDQFPTAVTNALAGTRFALVGFDATEADRALHALQDVQAFGRTLEPTSSTPHAADAKPVFDICVLKLPGDESPSAEPGYRPVSDQPLLLVGSRAQITAHGKSISSPYSDFVIEPWTSEELIMRAYHLLSIARAPTEEKRPGRTGPGHEPGQPLKALVADDDLATSILIKTALKSQGLDAATARDGGTALEMARTHQFAVIVLDINMPTLNGFEVLSALQSDDPPNTTPVLVVSNRHQEADIVRAFALGALDYVTKPFSPLELVARVRRILAV